MNRIRRTFTLHVTPDETGRYELQLKVATNGSSSSVATLRGAQLDRLRPSLVSAVTTSGHQRTVLGPTRRRPIQLNEDAGVRLALAALATGPLLKPVRVEAIRLGVEGMTSEEALYWYAHCTGPRSRRALRALRTLLAEE